MATVKQLEANQKNAQRSTGPRTQEGREKVRFNAVKHGLRAEVLEILPQEDPIEFDRRLDAWFDDYDPRTETEAFLVRRAAVLAWKIDRADCCEVALMSEWVHEAVNPILSKPQLDIESVNNEFLRAAWGASFPFGNDGEQLRRYQLALHRMLLRTLDALAKVRARYEKKNPPETTGAIKGAAMPPVGIPPRDDPAPEAPAPNKANSGETQPEIRSRKPDSASTPAPNKANFAASTRAISPRGARELERFIADGGRRDARNASKLDISIEKR